MSRSAIRSRLFKNRLLEKEHILPYTRLHLVRYPEDAEFETLLTRVLGGRANEDAARMKGWILAEIRKDFEIGRTENLDGWILSLTEVRLWCLYLAVTP